MKKKSSRQQQPSSIRIIGGEWRGTKLEVLDVAGLRPTTDRVRETLFNWLQAYIAGATCLDLYAGTGALGLEALSRGADHVTFFELNGRVAKQINQHLNKLQATDRGTVQTGDTRHLLSNSTPLKYDLVFVDPPFSDQLIESTILSLADKGWLNKQGLLYLESDANTEQAKLPNFFKPLREKRAGTARYALYEFDLSS
ncbi:MAG: 16S rRNA (guanine(966)-N(2))-methyltransferase RsmD [Pseudomonadota bacterium]